MKKIQFFIPLLLLIYLSVIPSQVSAKGVYQEKLTVDINLTLDNGDTVTIVGKGHLVKTPGSIFLKTFKFKLSDEIMDEIDFGYFANRIFGISLVLSGEKLVGAGFLNKAGILTVTVHKNGSGTFSPKGWLISFGLII